tara:strand:+ start:29337 stop:29933 length:597 start_codon:yes stop_codon:yes gene_type:complete
MATQFSMIGIFNAALLAQGQLEIVAANDGSMEYRTMARNWPAIVEAELEDGAYYFTKSEQHLITRSDGKFGFQDGYLVPSGALHVRNVWLLSDTSSKIEVDWVQDSANVYLNSPDGCWVETAICPEPDLWSANFVRGMQKRMEALISRSIKEEFGEAQQLDQEAEMYFQRARTNSSKARSAKPFYNKGPIASARNRRG